MFGLSGVTGKPLPQQRVTQLVKSVSEGFGLTHLPPDNIVQTQVPAPPKSLRCTPLIAHGVSELVGMFLGINDLSTPCNCIGHVPVSLSPLQRNTSQR